MINHYKTAINQQPVCGLEGTEEAVFREGLIRISGFVVIIGR
jgi:hypothetical protein